MSASTTTLDLFPYPSHPPSTHAPSRFPGADVSSTDALISALRQNHENFHIFFNDKRFHNHTSHHVLAIWALGANKGLIQAAYKTNASDQRPAIDPPERITENNFNEHLGDEKFFVAYINFFTKQITDKGVSAVLEEWIFARAANYIDGCSEEQQQPVMFARTMNALVHPMIHLGYGLEFGLPGMVIEGLAQAAVHYGHDAPLYPPSLFEESVAPVDSLTSKIGTELILDQPAVPSTGTKDLNLFDILARVLKDQSFSTNPDPVNFFSETMQNNSSIILGYANQWKLDLVNPSEVHRKIEELQFLYTLVFAVSGFNGRDKDFYADFFLMHLITSAVFLPSYIAYLTPSSQKILLRGYLTIALAWIISRRPHSFKLDIKNFVASTTPFPTTSSPSLIYNKPSFALTSEPNPWFPIIQDALIHPDSHLCKFQRALAHFGELYGNRKAGFAGTELEGAELVDGSLFIRAAGVTAEKMSRSGEFSWDR